MDLVKMASLGYLDLGMEKSAKDLRGHDLGADVARRIERSKRVAMGLGSLGGAALGYASGKDSGKPAHTRGIIGAGIGAALGSHLNSGQENPYKNLAFKKVEKAVPGIIDPRDVRDIYNSYGASGVGYAVAKADKEGKFRRGNEELGAETAVDMMYRSKDEAKKKLGRSAAIGAGLGLATAGGLAATKKVHPALIAATPLVGAAAGGKMSFDNIQRKRYMEDAVADYKQKRGVSPSNEVLENMRKYKDAGAYNLSNEYL